MPYIVYTYTERERARTGNGSVKRSIRRRCPSGIPVVWGRRGCRPGNCLAHKMPAHARAQARCEREREQPNGRAKHNKTKTVAEPLQF